MNGDVPCSPQNVFAGSVFHSKDRELYRNVHIDYKGEEISREKLMRLLESRVLPFVPRSRRLNTNPESRTTVFLTGHSGIGFSKIQDLEEYSAFDIANSLHHMQSKGRYDKMLWVGDTCRAASLHNEFYSPSVLAVGSSKERQSSYSRHGDLTLGVSVVDRFSYHAEQILKSSLIDRKDEKITVDKFSGMFDFSILMSDLSLRSDLLSGSERLVDFLSGTDRLGRHDIRIGNWNISGNGRQIHPKESREISTSSKRNLHSNPVEWLSPFYSILILMGFIILVRIS
jgi:phosphatidylinositol glycan class K